MANRSVVQAVIAIAVVVWGIGLTLEGVAVQFSWLRWYSLAVGVAVLCLMAFDRWLWRWKPLRRLTDRPHLAGTWRGEFRSTWVDPDTKVQVAPTEGYLVVRQTYSIVTVCLLTEDSRSVSQVAHLEAPRDGHTRLAYTYMNVPNLLVQDRSRIHYGTAFLDVHGSPPDALTGWYWTDRDSKGEMRFTARVAEPHTDFARAKRAFL